MSRDFLLGVVAGAIGTIALSWAAIEMLMVAGGHGDIQISGGDL